jgi:hypothetical protein
MKQLSWPQPHARLVRFYEAYEDEKHVHIIMDLCKGGGCTLAERSSACLIC